jgi:hypothetical protein
MTRLINMRDLGNLNMRAMFVGTPTLEDIYKAQIACGFEHNGYPQGVKIEVLDAKNLTIDAVTIVTFKLQRLR